MCSNTWGRVFHHADHPAIQVVPARGFAVFLGNSMLTHFVRAASKVHHLFLDVTSSGGAVTSCVMSWCCTCTGHMTFYYKRLVDALFEALLAHLALGSRPLVPPSGLPLSPTYGWCLMRVGRNVSSTSLG